MEAKGKENGGHVTNNRYERPKTSKERVQMRKEKTIVPKEKPPKLRRERTGMMKREKTMGLTRQKTTINDKSLKGKKVMTKSLIQEGVTSSSIKSGVNAILMGSLTVDLPPTAKIVRIFTSSTFKGGFISDKLGCAIPAYLPGGFYLLKTVQTCIWVYPRKYVHEPYLLSLILFLLNYTSLKITDFQMVPTKKPKVLFNDQVIFIFVTTDSLYSTNVLV